MAVAKHWIVESYPVRVRAVEQVVSGPFTSEIVAERFAVGLACSGKAVQASIVGVYVETDTNEVVEYERKRGSGP